MSKGCDSAKLGVEEAKASKLPASGDLRFQLCLIHFWL